MTIQDDIDLIDETILSLTKLMAMLQNDIKTVVTVNPNPSTPINPTPPNPATIGGNLTPTPKPYGIMTCVLIDKIIAEKPSQELDNVILSLNDFNILKQNDHVFTVIPPNPTTFRGVPNLGIHELNAWIATESITPVPPVPASVV